MPNIEVIEIGQRVPLFDQGRTDHGLVPYSLSISGQDEIISLLDHYSTLIMLHIEQIDGNIPINVQTIPTARIPKYECLTPFNPEAGYQITEADKNLVSRMGKIKRLRRRHGSLSVDQQVAPLAIKASSPTDDPSELPHLYYDISSETPPGHFHIHPINRRARRYHLRDEARDVLRNLRMQLFFPEAFESRLRASELLGENPNIVYRNRFYPIETGPLAASESRSKKGGFELSEGFYIAIPNKKDKITQIEVRFSL